MVVQGYPQEVGVHTEPAIHVREQQGVGRSPKTPQPQALLLLLLLVLLLVPGVCTAWEVQEGVQL